MLSVYHALTNSQNIGKAMNKTTNTLEDSCTGDGQAAPYTVRNLPGFLFMEVLT